MTSGQMPRAYNAADVERRIYQNWLDNGYFHATAKTGQQPYVIIMPPPNVTGELHLGHALEKALEDALIRYRRMTGTPTLWLPGTDHAGIATQWVVERQLQEEGISRHEMGREAFVERVWEHVEKSGGIIHEQSRRLGISADWERHKFTLDPGPATPSAPPSSACTKRGSSTGTSASSTAACAAPPPCRTWKWTTRTLTGTSTTSATRWKMTPTGT